MSSISACHRGEGSVSGTRSGAVGSATVGMDNTVGTSVGAVGMDVNVNAAGPLAGLFTPSAQPAPEPTFTGPVDQLPVPKSPATPVAPTTPATSVAPPAPPGLIHSKAVDPLPSASAASSVGPPADHGSVSRSPQRKTPTRTARVSSTSKARGSSSPPSVRETAPTESSEPVIQEPEVPAAAEERPFTAPWHVDQVRSQTWHRALERRLAQSETSNRELAGELKHQKDRDQALEGKLETLSSLVETKAADSQRYMADLVGVMNDRFDLMDSSLQEMTVQHDSLQGRLMSLGTMIESMASSQTQRHNIATPPSVQPSPPNLLGPSGNSWCGHAPPAVTAASPTIPSMMPTAPPMMPTMTTAADFGTASAMAPPQAGFGPVTQMPAAARAPDAR